MIAHRRSLRGLFIRLAILCCLIVATFSVRGAGVAQYDAGANDLLILRSIFPVDGSDTVMLPLDPRTLADVTDSGTFQIEPGIMPWTVIFSRDGQVIAGMTNKNDKLEIVVKRGLNGLVLSRIPVGGSWWPEALSSDGSKLLVMVNLDSGSFGWKVFETSTGKMTSESRPEFGVLPVPNAHGVDTLAWRLYRLAPDDIESLVSHNTTGPVNLVEIDLATGNESARLRLQDVLFGSVIDRSDPSHWVSHVTIPGIAVSPDGGEIAVVSATDDVITLVDTKTMTVKRTLTMQEKPNLVDRLFALLPLAPQTVSAKASDGVVRSVFYSADGERLYVSGSGAELVDDTSVVASGHGLRVVDLDSGTIEVHVLDGVSVNQIVEGSNGNLYVTGADFRGHEKQGYPYAFLVARLDGNAGDMLSERSFSDSAVLILAPAASD